MPPFIPRKRLRSTSSPEAEASTPKSKAKGKGTAKSTSVAPRKPTLFDDIDAGTSSKRTAEHRKAALQKLVASDDEHSSLSSLTELDFEDIPGAKRQKISGDSGDEDEDIEFEDVQTYIPPVPAGPPPSGDLELTLTKETRISLTNPHGTKKGPSKIERQIRTATHQVHVQMLMWHNAIRNSWLCDKEVQEILVKQLPRGAEVEITRWKQHNGLNLREEKGREAKEKGENIKGKKTDVRSQRDWGELAEKLEDDQINLSRADPLIRLLTWLSRYWKKRFTITAPGLRKMGYMSLQRLDEEMKSFNKDEHDVEQHGERVRDIKEFRKLAKSMKGSRDVGAQLFTALLRGIGIEARMVASLQPVGFGWAKNEEAIVRKEKMQPDSVKQGGNQSDDEEDTSDEEGEKPAPKSTKTNKGKASAQPKKPSKSTKKFSRYSSQGNGFKDAPINLSGSEELDIDSDDDDESVIDVTLARQRINPSKLYDRDLLFPHYWTEALSPITNTYTPVDALVLNIIATDNVLLEKFEPRGAKADKAKQVTAYIIGHSSDGTAKDVTIRYLKRHMWPGRTKGNRIAIEKLPVYNHKGKIKRHEEYDWFKTVMSSYVRGSRKCPLTEIDDHEDATDLKAVKPEKKEVKEGEETLQSYKSSAEFVLERHLRREEALLPTAKHVKIFTAKGKGDTSTEEKVFLRKDVVNCKSMETWHKEGRAPLPGVEPMKRVPYRAATTNRKRELAEAEYASGEKMLQGLFSMDQTDWIIPPPIENGVIPKNSYGNMDVFVPSMIPEGAVHIPRRGMTRICKRLGIDFAEAVTGFEFGARMAIPIITGVVVAEENLEILLEEWENEERERARKEDEKRTKAALGMWRKMLMGMRIVERVREEYGDEVGDEVDVLNPWTNKKNGKETEGDEKVQRRIIEQRDEDMAGGFLPEGHDEEEAGGGHSSSFFPVVHEDDDDGNDGGFIVEGHDEPTKSTKRQVYPTPQSMQSNTKWATARESEDAEGSDLQSEPGAPAPKKRGRPTGPAKSKASTPSRTQPSTLAKPSCIQKKTSASRTARKRERKIADTDEEEEEEDDQTSSLSDVESNELECNSSEVEESQENVPRSRTTESLRKVPRRNAARKSETALRSHYFQNSDDGDDDE